MTLDFLGVFMKKVARVANWISEKSFRIIIVSVFAVVVCSFFEVITKDTFSATVVFCVLFGIFLVIQIAFAIDAMYPLSDFEEKKQ